MIKQVLFLLSILIIASCNDNGENTATPDTTSQGVAADTANKRVIEGCTQDPRTDADIARYRHINASYIRTGDITKEEDKANLWSRYSTSKLKQLISGLESSAVVELITSACVDNSPEIALRILNNDGSYTYPEAIPEASGLCPLPIDCKPTKAHPMDTTKQKKGKFEKRYDDMLRQYRLPEVIIFDPIGADGVRSSLWAHYNTAELKEVFSTLEDDAVVHFVTGAYTSGEKKNQPTILIRITSDNWFRYPVDQGLCPLPKDCRPVK